MKRIEILLVFAVGGFCGLFLGMYVERPMKSNPLVTDESGNAVEVNAMARRVVEASNQPGKFSMDPPKVEVMSDWAHPKNMFGYSADLRWIRVNGHLAVEYMDGHGHTISFVPEAKPTKRASLPDFDELGRR